MLLFLAEILASATQLILESVKTLELADGHMLCADGCHNTKTSGVTAAACYTLDVVCAA